MSLAELQRQTNISRRTLEDWESQKATPTVYHRIKKVAEVLACSPDEIMSFEKDVIYMEENATLMMADVEGGVVIDIYDEKFALVYSATVTSELAFDLYQRYRDKDVWDLSYEPLFE